MQPHLGMPYKLQATCPLGTQRAKLCLTSHFGKTVSEITASASMELAAIRPSPLPLPGSRCRPDRDMKKRFVIDCAQRGLSRSFRSRAECINGRTENK